MKTITSDKAVISEPNKEYASAYESGIKRISELTDNLSESSSAIDPSEHLGFTRPLSDGVIRYDIRTEKQLKEAIFDHELPLERERALWELLSRSGDSQVDLVEEFLMKEQCEELRWGALWASQKYLIKSFDDITLTAFKDDNLEVRDWARILLAEVKGKAPKVSEVSERSAKWIPDAEFDQTLPLLIGGYARVRLPDGTYAQATLSPLWFESILGRVMACTNEKTFKNELVIEKCISQYHPDKSDHYEIYKFNGFSQKISEGVNYHHYESTANHTFYPSGKVEDCSMGPLNDVSVVLGRGAVTQQRLFDLDKPRKLVESVRGRYMGYAFTDVDRMMNNGMRIGPGEVQLSSLSHPIAGPLTNTFLYGTFRGKISDWDGDGQLDANTILCHGTVDGKLDYHADSCNSPDPYDPFSLV